MQWPVGGVVQLLSCDFVVHKMTRQKYSCGFSSEETVNLVRLTKILLSQIPDYNVAIAEEIFYYEIYLWLLRAANCALTFPSGNNCVSIPVAGFVLVSSTLHFSV